MPQFVPPQLSQLVDKPASGPQWVHEIKLHGFRMAARLDNGRVQEVAEAYGDPAIDSHRSVAGVLDQRARPSLGRVSAEWDAAAFASKRAGFFRAVFVPSLSQALAPARDAGSG
jgi:hypothetical protein